MTALARLKRGDYVRLRLEGSTGEWTEGFVAMASDSDPSSVLLLFDGVVRAGSGLIAGGLPLTVDYAAETVYGVPLGDSYEIEVRS